MAKLKAYIPSISASLAITVLEDGKEKTAYDFKDLTYTDMSNKQIKKQEKGREDWFKKYRELLAKEETSRLLNIKLNSLPSTDKIKGKELERVKKEQGRISDKLLLIKDKTEVLTDEMNEITDKDPDKFENIIEDEFKISIGGGDLEALVGVIESDDYPQITYSSVLEALKEDAKEKKGN